MQAASGGRNHEAGLPGQFRYAGRTAVAAGCAEADRIGKDAIGE
jgi:hypothetical protein